MGDLRHRAYITIFCFFSQSKPPRHCAAFSFGAAERRNAWGRSSQVRNYLHRGKVVTCRTTFCGAVKKTTCAYKPPTLAPAHNPPYQPKPRKRLFPFNSRSRFKAQSSELHCFTRTHTALNSRAACRRIS